MKPRPIYTIYEDCLMDLRHGHPLWVADPGSEEKKIQVGDIGYYQYGQFIQVARLPLRKICGESHSLITQHPIFPKPLANQKHRVVEYYAGAGAAPSVPVEIGGNASVKTEHHEAAALALETGQALFTFLNEGDRAKLASYVISHYEDWHKGGEFGTRPVEDIVVVSGTYMTKNWNAVACARDSGQHSGDVHASIPQLVDAQGGVVWDEWQNSTPGYSCGHQHDDDSDADFNDFELTKFRDCGRAGCPPRTQCIFLHTLRIRERIRLWRFAMVKVGAPEEVPITKYKLVLFPKESSSAGSSGQASSSTGGDPVDDIKVGGVQSIDSDCEALYDTVAHEKFQANPELKVVVVSDDEVIRYLGGDPYPTAIHDGALGSEDNETLEVPDRPQTPLPAAQEPEEIKDWNTGGLSHEMVRRIVELLKDKDGDVRLTGIAAFGKLAEQSAFHDQLKGFLPQIIELLKDMEDNVRSAGAATFGKLAEQSAFQDEIKGFVPQIIELLKDVEGNIRLAGLEIFGKLAEQSAFQDEIKGFVPQIMELLKDVEGNIRSAGVKIFGKLAEQSAFQDEIKGFLPPIVELLKDTEENVRSAGAATFGKLAEKSAFQGAIKDVIPQIAELLKNVYSNIRSTGAATFGKLAKQSAFQDEIKGFVPQIIELLKDVEGNIRSAGVTIFGKLAEQSAFQGTIKDVIPQIAELLKNTNLAILSTGAATFSKLAEQRK